jgi:hypothetical protein
VQSSSEHERKEEDRKADVIGGAQNKGEEEVRNTAAVYSKTTKA